MVRSSVRVWLGAVAAVAMLTVACAETDPGVTTAVKAKLAADDTVKAYRIDVDTQDKVVTLKGEVDTAAARTRAVEIAKGTAGVRDVVDQLTVQAGVTPPGGMDDVAQAKAAEAGRTADAKTDEAQKKTGDAVDRAGDAVATAGRKAGDAADKAGDKIGDAASKSADATADAAVTAKVKTKFLADSSISGLKIDVDTKANVVTLTGTVATAAEKRRAVEVAKETDGVKSVVDRLKVGTY
jgi:hyperosmotically inducible periplasmic protein